MIPLILLARNAEKSLYNAWEKHQAFAEADGRLLGHVNHSHFIFYRDTGTRIRWLVQILEQLI